MTVFEIIQTVLGAVTALVAIGGFVGLIWQMQNLDAQLGKLEQELAANARGSIFDMGARLKEIFVERPDLRKYFFANTPVDSDSPKYETLVAITDFYCLYLEQISTEADKVLAGQRQKWLMYVAAIYHQSPMIRDYLADKRDWYSDEFWNAVDEFAPCVQEE